jgi:hypothetical protein
MSVNKQPITINEGQVIPCNGKVLDGCALVDESACCGVSAPVWVDSARGSHEVYKAGLIVNGWLVIEPQDETPAPPVEPEPVLATTQPPAKVVAASPAPIGKAHVIGSFFVALVAALACAWVATQFTHSDPIIVSSGVGGFLATVWQM